MKTLIVDNYDSFTINLYQMVAKLNGTKPLVIRNDQVSWEVIKNLEFDNIIISPGPGCPTKEQDFGICRQLILEANVPLLGVCLGHQGLGYLHGGTIRQAPEVMHGRLSKIYHDASELFRSIPSPFFGVRYHSLIVEEPLPPILERIAWTADGLLMGLRHREKPFWGLQFHPESISTEYGIQLLENFRELTREFWNNGRFDRRVFPVELPKIISVVPSNKPILEESTLYEVHTRKLNFFRDSEDVFLNLYGESPVAFWLDSSRVEHGLSRFSFMGDTSGPHSFLVRYRVNNGELTLSQAGNTTSRKGNLFDFLELELSQRYYRTDHLPFDFNCGFVGYFGYELKGDCGSQCAHTSSLPDAAFLLADRLVVFDHQEQILYLVCLTQKDGVMNAEAWFKEIEWQLLTLSCAPKVQPEHRQEPIVFRLSRSYDTYLHDIQICLDKITQGETYEVCLTNHIRTDYRPDPITLYRTLRRINPAPYSAFLRLDDMAVVCSSPERFLCISQDRWVESKPIKGTCKRGETPIQDLLLKETLQNSDKNRSENLMIVDLLRNDLGLVCEVGTVHVPKLMHIETYATVHQMLSTVRGYLRADMRSLDCVRMAFPGGSMTGAPKKRTMEIIDKLESEARGVYSGSIGFLALNGMADLNIVIRTAVISPTDMTIGTGGAIVALSSPEEEFDETMLKARALIQAILLTAHGTLDKGKFEFPMATFKNELCMLP
ncbi:aminodeoxychorismate synthase, component I [Nostocales cyanobacterium HT-58-2]|nr:aminodeoxychorismate synthase, component I [Nostocales cyanobacterium HT-58-2]